MAESTKDRILTVAVRLFGEQGFAATGIAQIERAAGLSGGSGALYRHFASKQELLVESVRAQLTDREAWAPYLADDFSVAALLAEFAPEATLSDRLVFLCQIGLERLNHDRDVTRILMRDNSIDPQVLDVFRREELAVVNRVVARGLAELAAPDAQDQDWDALAAVLVGAIAHYWIITDIFDGEHPLAMDDDRYLRAASDLVAARLVQPPRTPFTPAKPMRGSTS